MNKGEVHGCQVSGFRCQETEVLNPRMRQLKANRRISNIEPQNVEVWNRFAQSFIK